MRDDLLVFDLLRRQPDHLPRHGLTIPERIGRYCRRRNGSVGIVNVVDIRDVDDVHDIRDILYVGYVYLLDVRLAAVVPRKEWLTRPQWKPCCKADWTTTDGD
jgi:hypothetical protein